MFKYLSFLSPYKWLALGIVATLIVAYITFLNIRINYLKSDNAELEAKNVLWQSKVKILAQSVEKSNGAIENMLKSGLKQSQKAQVALKQARKSNTIRQDKITAARARIVLENPQSCESAIESAKKELR